MARIGKIATSGLVGALALLGPASAPASAGMLGDCTLVATWALGLGIGPVVLDVDATPADQPVTVPAADTVTWVATSPGAVRPRLVKGLVELDLPWPFSTLTLDSWSGPAQGHEATGTYQYELTGLVPRAVPLTFQGAHAEENDVRCTGRVQLELEGGPFDGWLAYVALGGLAASGIALFFAGRSRWYRVL
jgi:hypothetical protein